MNDPRARPQERGGVLGWVIAHPKTLITLVLLLLLTLTCVFFNVAMQKRLDRRLRVLRAQGMPTTLEELVATLPVIPDDRNMALPILEQAGAMLALQLTQEQKETLPLVGFSRSKPTGRRLPEDQLEAARWYLAQIDAERAAVHQALQLDHGCSPINWSSPALGVTLPGLSQYRHVAKVLALEATLAAEEGDAERAGEVLADLCHLDRVMECDAFLIGALVRMAIQTLACDQIERTVNLCGLSDAGLRRLDERLREMEASIDYKGAMVAERIFFIDMIKWARSGRGGGIGVPTVLGPGTGAVAGVWRYVPGLPAADAAMGIKMYGRMVDAIDRPDAASIHRLRSAGRNFTAIPQYYVMTRMLLPSLMRSSELWVRRVGQNRALRAALACERFRLETGGWPKTLDALVPDYLDAVPLDPFDGKPIRYAVFDEGIRVWTIAENEVDDRGDIGRLRPAPGPYSTRDAGWLLLNPDLRARPATEPNP